jgi:metallo-beta-lactamase class B
MKAILIILLVFINQTLIIAQTNNKTVTVSNDIKLIELSENVYVHVSYYEFPKFGRYPSNAIIYINKENAFLFDTPANDSLTKILVSWITDTMKLKLIGFVPNHWHNDCMGGLTYLQSIGIPSFANEKTIDIAKTKGLPIPSQGFKDSVSLPLGDKIIKCYFLGAAHSLDNIVVWLPNENVLFAGCMVKDLNAKGLGNTEDANLIEWPKTIDKVIAKFPNAKFVIPGHGEFGGLELLQHTKQLFKK